MKRTQFKKEIKLQKHLAVLGAILIAGAGIGTYYYINKTQTPSSPKVEKVTKKKPSISKRVDQLTLEQVIATVIIYMHRIDNRTQDWASVYQLGKSDGLQIEKYHRYHFNEYTLKASKDELIYIIDKKAAFVFNNNQRRSTVKLLTADRNEKLTKTSLLDMYQKLLADNLQSDLQNISHNLEITNKVQVQKQAKKSAKKKITLITVPKDLRGTWYYSTNIKGHSTIEALKLRIHTVREGQVFDSHYLSKKHYSNPALHTLQNKYPNALQGEIKKKDAQDCLLVYDILDKDKAREEFSLKNGILQIQSNNKVVYAYPSVERVKKSLKAEKDVSLKFDDEEGEEDSVEFMFD